MTFRLLGKEFHARMSDLLAGAVFTIMGVLTLVWAFEGPMVNHSELQIDINIYLTKFQQFLNRFIGGVPQFVWAIVIVGLFVWLGVVAYKQSNKDKENQK